VGIARVHRPARAAPHAAPLRHLRQQLRGGGRVRAARAGEERARRRRQRRPGVAPLRRPGAALRARRVQGRAVPP
jgi:hypothetical protein